MKRILRFLPLTIAACLFFFAFVGSSSSCEDVREDVLVHVAIIDQPEGGSNVNTVTCTFEATMSRTDGKSDPLDVAARVSAVWHSPHGIYNSSTTELFIPGQPTRITISKSAPAGMHLDKPFWLEIFWYDADGNNTVLSDTADCQ